MGCKEAGVVTDYHGTIYCGLKLDNGESFKLYIGKMMIHLFPALHIRTQGKI